MPALSLDVPPELIKDPHSWTVEDIGIWLHWLGIGEHSEAFAARGVDGRTLLQLGAETAWAELGVVDVAQQRVLDSAVEPLRGFSDFDSADSGLALHAVEGPIAGEVVLVGAGGITGGRHSVSNGIVLSENYVSRRHFQITRDRAGQYLLQDIGSTTGTFLMVREQLPLEHSMVLQLGTTELTVHIEEGACTLVATEGPDKDVRATVRDGQGLFVGREPSNGLYIRDPQISVYHCEVRHDLEQGFLLEDKYSTNRTWLRLAPDGQPSKCYVLRVGDLVKVGSTLFHVVDPSSLPEPQQVMMHRATSPDDHGRGDVGQLPSTPPSSRPAMSSRAPLGDGGDDGEEEWDLVDGPRGVAAGPHAHAPGDDPAGSSSESDVEGSAAMEPRAQGLRWEPFNEALDSRPYVPAEYARRMTASRRQHAQGARRGSPGATDQASSVQQRELTSLQIGMRNSRAQTAYTLQQQRSPERRDEDLCKICYDKDIDVVLYPCGHFILCRWCAFKVSDCPVCRLVITHVIRTFKG